MVTVTGLHEVTIEEEKVREEHSVDEQGRGTIILWV